MVESAKQMPFVRGSRNYISFPAGNDNFVCMALAHERTALEVEFRVAEDFAPIGWNIIFPAREFLPKLFAQKHGCCRCVRPPACALAARSEFPRACVR